jgi:hypothetical protein
LHILANNIVVATENSSVVYKEFFSECSAELLKTRFILNEVIANFSKVVQVRKLQVTWSLGESK